MVEKNTIGINEENYMSLIEQIENGFEPKQKMHNAQLGLTTREAILNGAYWGVINEINGYIEKYSKEYRYYQ